MRKLRETVPPGQKASKWMLLFAVCSFVSTVYTGLGWWSYFQQYRVYISYIEIESLPKPDYFYLFSEIFMGSFSMFNSLSFVILLQIIFNYLYFKRGSQSIYLMKRLPKKKELWIRVFTMPVIGACLLMLLKFIVIAISYIVYLKITPAEWLAPDSFGSLSDLIFY